jgi:hypothetical protein|tara:strand:- start:338 stop:592 length:255 start_codon:yes stop_codon:yes gene_type:complete
MKNMKINFKFKTEAEYMSARFIGYIEEYDMARFDVLYDNGTRMDFPVHSEEEFNKESERLKNDSQVKNIRTYQSSHWYDIQDYI